MSNDRVPVSARIDLKLLAEIALFLDEVGVPPQNRSAILRRGLQSLSQAGQSEGLTKSVPTNEEAVKVLENFGITFESNKQTSADIGEVLSEESLTEGSTDKDAEEAVDAVFEELGLSDEDSE